MNQTKYNPKEVFASVVEAILDEATIRSSDSYIPLFFRDKLFEQITPFHVQNILEKLRDDYGMVRKIISPESLDYVENPPQWSEDNPKYYNVFYVVISDMFEHWAENYLEKFHKSKDGGTQNQTMGNNGLEISLLNNRQIVLNGIFLLSKPDFGKENEMVFSFLFEHPNVAYQRDQISKAIGEEICKSFHKIVENLGFSPDLRKCFFEIGKDKIMFRNPVGLDDVKKMGMDYIRLK